MNLLRLKPKKEKKKPHSLELFFLAYLRSVGVSIKDCWKKNVVFWGVFFFFLRKVFVRDGSSRICRHLVKSFLFCGSADKV